MILTENDKIYLIKQYIVNLMEFYLFEPIIELDDMALAVNEFLSNNTHEHKNVGVRVFEDTHSFEIFGDFKISKNSEFTQFTLTMTGK